jgi:hypothetical protein
MENESGYLPLQQPGAGYNVPGAVNYGSQQTPASGGGGSGTAQAAKVYDLPDPETGVWSGHKARYPHVSTLPLFEKNKLSPLYDQIFQQNIGNCYLGAALAAMANTNAGRRQIIRMITPHRGAITTICKKYEAFSKNPPEQRLKSCRWFTVAFKDNLVDVSNVLYHDDSTPPNLMYMTTPGADDRALWGAIIEVAYAKMKGGYDKITASSTTVEQFLDEFSAMQWEFLLPATDKAAIKKACKSADKRATFIATKERGTKILISFHGYAVLSMSDTKVKLWDPLHGKAEIKFKDLLTEVQAVIRSS